jgi:alanyl-tRNA synthetase
MKSVKGMPSEKAIRRISGKKGTKVVLEVVSAAGKRSRIELVRDKIKLKSEAAKNAMGDVTDNVREIGGIRFLAARMEGVDANGLRELGDSLKEKLGECVIVLASVADGKVQLMATATDGALKKGAHAGSLIKGIAKFVGGGGGGRQRPQALRAGHRHSPVPAA